MPRCFIRTAIVVALWCALACAAADRPKVALVLSVRGARGLAHIGVLKVLEELRVPVDFIVATSMGSIVGGAYSAGHTPGEMEALVKAADWNLMFSDRPPRHDLSFRRKEDDLRFIGKSEVGLKLDGVMLPRGAFGSQNLEEFLRLVARPAADTRNLDQLPIPLRAVATDLVSGEMVVLRDVPLAVAMRASMSIPGAFAPTNVDDRLLGDGGLARNLPVEVAREMGADVIIAVNVGTPLLPRAALSSAISVAQQMINILTEQNVAISLAALRPTDILVSPNLSGVSFVDFERGPELIAIGAAAAREVAGRLKALGVDERAYEAFEFRRTRHPVAYDQRVVSVRVEGTARTNPDALRREIADRTGIVQGQSGSDEQLTRAARVLYGLGEFERVDVHIETNNGRRFVVIDVDEKPWGPNYLRLGGRAIADFHTDARFSITAQHTRTWVNAWGAEWRNELQVGDVRRFMTAFYQPLGPGSPWFVEPVLQATESDYDIFGAVNRRTDRITKATNSAAIDLGHRLGSTGVARLTFGYERYRSTPSISATSEGTVKDSGKYARFTMRFDTLDDANFPRSGYLVGAGVQGVRYSSGGPTVQQLFAQALLPVTYDRLTLVGLVGTQRSRDDLGGVSMGGFLDLSGTPVGAVSGSQALYVGGLAYYRVGELPRALGRSWYAGVSLEAGNAWLRRSDMSAGSLRKAASVYLGLDTVIGPLYLGWGHTFGGDSALYLFLGRPTGTN